MKRDLTEILSDPLLNPKAKNLTYVETARARLELTRAQSLMNIIDGEIRLEYNLGMEELRSEGQFIEHAPGETYHKIDGVLTAGQIIPDGGVRMFYFYPERFPQVYEKKAVRRLARFPTPSEPSPGARRSSGWRSWWAGVSSPGEE